MSSRILRSLVIYMIIGSVLVGGYFLLFGNRGEPVTPVDQGDILARLLEHSVSSATVTASLDDDGGLVLTRSETTYGNLELSGRGSAELVGLLSDGAEAEAMLVGDGSLAISVGETTYSNLELDGDGAEAALILLGADDAAVVASLEVDGDLMLTGGGAVYDNLTLSGDVSDTVLGLLEDGAAAEVVLMDGSPAFVIGDESYLNLELAGGDAEAVTRLLEINVPAMVTLQDSTITAAISGSMFETRDQASEPLLRRLNESQFITNYTYTVNNSSFWSSVGRFLLGLLPFVLIIGLLIYFLRQAQGGGNQAMGFGKSRAKLFNGISANVTFNEVAGVEEAKEELREIVEFLKFPDKFRALGAKIPRGVLLVGPPGTGKTLVSRAVAGEANVPFFSISGSEFVEMFVGVGASRVRDLFGQAKQQAPCIIFVDEIDAVGRHRGAGLGGGHDEREQTLNQILVEMDGFDSNTNIIIIAATNRPDILDPALLRPGRFDRRVILDAPDVRGREQIIDVHARGKPLAKEVDFGLIAKQTPGFSGADLANLINEAALLTARRSKHEIGMDELTESIDRVSIGPARKSRVISKEEREMVAYHESGHAIVSHFMPSGKPVGKISIMSRGHAGGFTRYQQDDHSLLTKDELKAMIASAMGGRVAEELKFKKTTSGASSDFEQATKIARQMVTRLGMSSKLGARVYGKREEAIFLGKEMSEQRDYSLRVEGLIDAEIDGLLQEGLDNAERLLKKHSKKMEALANYLLENETAEAYEFTEIMEGRKPEPKVQEPPAAEEPPADAGATAAAGDAGTEKKGSPEVALGLG